MLNAAQNPLIAFLEVSCKSGEISTEQMMPVSEKPDLYKIEIQKVETERESIRKKLILLVEPKPIVELTREDARAAVIEDVEMLKEPGNFQERRKN
jgi:hypothetical protein